MKTCIKRLISSVCVFALILILSSCSVFLELDHSKANDWVSKTVNVEINKQLIFSDTNDNSGHKITNQVVFNADQTTEPLSKIESANKVKRSVVKIDIHTSTSNSAASGVIVDITGGLNTNEYYILTCHHVIAGGGDIRVCVPDDNARNKGDVGYDKNYEFLGVIGSKNLPEQKSSVMLVGGDRETDIAVLKLIVGNRKNEANEPVSIVKSKVAPSTYNFSYAEEVFAIGNPTGLLPMTYLDGAISYEDRLVVVDPIGYMSLIQHNCLTTHGSSGGGLFNMQGQLIGITNAGSDQYKGINYAVPFSGEDGFVKVATELIKTNTTTNFGYVEGRWDLGITTKAAQTQMNNSNLVVNTVETNGNCYGVLKTGDYITNIKCVKQGYEELNYDIKYESDFTEVIYLLREYVSVGDTIQITIARRSEI